MVLRRTACEPPYPKNVYGWKDYMEGTTKIRGSFLLKKGGSTANGSIKVTVIDILAPKCTGDAGDSSARARATLEFWRLPDQRVLCSQTLPENGEGNLSIPGEFGSSALASELLISKRVGYSSFLMVTTEVHRIRGLTPRAPEPREFVSYQRSCSSNRTSITRGPVTLALRA